MFSQVHNKMDHVGYAQIYQQLSKRLYICHMAKLLRKYLHHCPKCQLQMTSRHLLYGSLQLIISPPRPFYTITIDFILVLLTFFKGFDSAMSVIDKFSKRVMFIAGKIAWGAKEWAIELFNQLNQVNWGLPSTIFLDRNRQFVAELWGAIFKKLKVDLLFSTAYHAQINGKLNLTAKIALRHLLPDFNSEEQWPKALLQLQAIIINLQNTNSTELSPNKIIYGFRTKESIDILPHNEQEVRPDPIETYQHLRTDPKDAIAFAQMAMEDQYDRCHTSRFFEVRDQVNLRLHQGYTLLGITNWKTGQHFAGPVTILERVGKLAYHLEIHSMISIAHLEQATNPADDLYRRSRLDHQGPVEPEDNMEPTKDHYVVEKLLGKRTSQGQTQYLVRWLGYGPEHNVWYDITNLYLAKDLVNKYNQDHEAGTSTRPKESHWARLA